MTYELMIGHPPTARLHGWAALAQSGMYGEPTLELVWVQHRDELIDGAAAYNFEPFWERKAPPTGDGFRRWQWQFVQRHTY